MHLILRVSIFIATRSQGQFGSSAAVNIQEVGVSENSVPLNPMVNDHYPY